MIKLSLSESQMINLFEVLILSNEKYGLTKIVKSILEEHILNLTTRNVLNQHNDKIQNL
jgi:hypothetical protein